MATDEPTSAAVAGTTQIAADLDQMERMSRSFGSALATALDDGVVKGRALDDVLSGLALRLSDLALRAALKPVTDALGGAVVGLADKLIGAATSPAGSGSVAGSTTPFAAGGVVAAPTYFPMAGSSLGLAGEAGAEAIIPLARDGSGQLGVRAASAASPVNVTVNIATPDVAGFRRSEAEVTAALARAVARGRRGL
ncbi:MAG TPA: phage tail tape measure protein [Hyphomicrobiales bacterium]|nr:phage tail tape measure protein [Hyphomicrobiales bacterium]